MNPPIMPDVNACGMADPRSQEQKVEDEKAAECGSYRNARRVSRKEARKRRKPY